MATRGGSGRRYRFAVAFHAASGGNVIEIALDGNYHRLEGWEEACTDAAGPDGGGIAVVGHSERRRYRANAFRSVVPFLKFHGWEDGKTVGFDLTVDLKKHLRRTVEAEHYDNAFAFYAAMREMWRMRGSEGVEPVPPTRKKWSHYPVRMIPVPSDLSGVDDGDEKPVADLVVLLSSSASAQRDDRESLLEEAFRDYFDDSSEEMRLHRYAPPSNL